MDEPVAPPNFYKLYKDSSDSQQSEPVPPPPPPPQVPEGFTVMDAMSIGDNNNFINNYDDAETEGTLLNVNKPFDVLYSSEEDPGDVLRKLNRSLVFNYLQLLDVLASKGGETAAQANKVADIETIMYNINYLIDELKPFLVKEAILKKVEAQLNRKRRLIAELEESVRVNGEKLNAIYKGAGTIFAGSEEVLAESEKLLNAENSQVDASEDVEMKDVRENNDDDDDNNENDPEAIKALLDTVTK